MSSDYVQVPVKKKYQCQQCERSFGTSGHLTRHIRIHTGERNYKCPFPGCDTRCSRQDNLQQHYRIHLSPGSRTRKSNSNPSRRSSGSRRGTSLNATPSPPFSTSALSPLSPIGMLPDPLHTPPLMHNHSPSTESSHLVDQRPFSASGAPYNFLHVGRRNDDHMLELTSGDGRGSDRSHYLSSRITPLDGHSPQYHSSSAHSNHVNPGLHNNPRGLSHNCDSPLTSLHHLPSSRLGYSPSIPSPTGSSPSTTPDLPPTPHSGQLSFGNGLSSLDNPYSSSSRMFSPTDDCLSYGSPSLHLDNLPLPGYAFADPDARLLPHRSTSGGRGDGYPLYRGLDMTDVDRHSSRHALRRSPVDDSPYSTGSDQLPKLDDAL